MKKLKGSPLVTPIATTAVIAAAVACTSLLQGLHSSQVISEDVRAAVARDGQANVVVSLGFQPEAFNVNKFQEYSNAASVDGTNVRLFGVTDADLRSIGRLFWVEAVELPG